MRLNRVIKYINGVIALLLLAALGATYWFVWRALPVASGAITAPVGGPATIVRDSLGVAHIRAGSIEDAVFLQGYTHASERMFQMDLLRRMAAGELSEVFGKVTLETDLESRRLRLRRIAEELAAALSAEDRRLLAAYARGVNHYLSSRRDTPSVEFRLLRYSPRPWRIADTLLVGMNMQRTLSSTWKDEVMKAALLENGEKEKVEMLFPPRASADSLPGSNGWAISGRHTATGKPILASDPHLEWSLPAVWYLVHLQAPGLNVMGGSLPGVPCVVIGHNERIAWGMTTLMFDVTDLYAEQFAANGQQVLYRGQPAPVRLERDVVSVKGEGAAVLNQVITPHGPVLIPTAKPPLALRWAAGPPFALTFLQVNQAANWEQFRSALRGFPGPNHNFIYADVDGNVGYQAAGRFPIRKGNRGDVPADGASGAAEWEGFIPFEELPSIYNPPSGMIISANQNPFPADYKYAVAGRFDPEYRFRQIRDRLRRKAGWKPEEMLGIQTDVYSGFSHFLAQQVVATWDRRKASNPSVKEAVDSLRNWNGQMRAAEVAPLVTTLVFQQLRREVANRASPNKGTAWETLMSTAVIEKLLRERPSDWFDNYDELILRALADAVEEGKKRYGPNIGNWRYGAYNALRLQHPVLSRVPQVGQFFTLGPVGMDGSSTTVKQTTPRIGPSMRMVADLSNWDNSLLNTTVGQSGMALSKHFDDQWKPYLAGRSFPMQFRNVNAVETLNVAPGN